MTIDPVCEMKVNETVAFHSTYEGKTYYFCSAICKAMFERDPGKYVLQQDDEKKSEE
ncbi:MAG: YHS domain-containing protein [Chloroflexi bacterium]|nr:YHS domain-containing protein [Chloroflexota bacterium]